MCLAAASWAVGVPAFAEPSSDWLAEYAVAPSCPAPVTFRSMVERRLVGRPEALERARVQVEISASAAAGSFLGQVGVLDAAGHRISRELADTSCDALAHALSLIVALGVDELGDAAAEPAFAANGAAVASRDEWGPDPPESEGLDSGAAAHGAERSRFRVGALVRSAVQSGFAPRPVLGIGGGVRLEWDGTGPWSPQLDLAAMSFDSPRFTHSADAQVQFDALMLDASLCPLDLVAAAAWSMRPCLDLEAGRLTVSGSGRAVARPQARSAPWLSSGVSLQGGVAPWAGPVQLSLAVGGFVPLFRSQFHFSPNIEAFEVPAAGWHTSAGLGMVF
jgi:hypothetical protein